jgi:cation diffusion facilitator family transporter
MNAGRPSLTQYAWLAIIASLVNISLKLSAYWVTNSIGFLTDGLESFVNVGASCLALAVIKVSQQPPDEEHTFGHEKAEYFSGGVEGALIFMAAAIALISSVPRFYHPVAVLDLGTGAVLSLTASLVNLMVGLSLRKQGRIHQSLALEADAQHLLSDVVFSVGVVLGVALTHLTHWETWDPLVGVTVSIYMAGVGVMLVRRAVDGLLDASMSAPEMAQIHEVMDAFRNDRIDFHALRTRRAGRSCFMQVHVLVPGEWTVRKGHQLLEDLEQALRTRIPTLRIITHLEPLEDPCSFEDIPLDREAADALIGVTGL